MATVCLDHQIFYTAPAAANLKPTSRGLLAQNPLSSAVSGNPLRLPPPPELQNAVGSQLGGARTPKNNGIEMTAGAESDYDTLDEGRPRNKLESESVTGTADSSPPPLPQDAGRPQPGSTRIPANDVIEISSDEESDDDTLGPPRCKAVCAGDSCRRGLGCPRHPNLSTKIYRKQWLAKELRARADSPPRRPYTLPGGSFNTAQSPRSAASSLGVESQQWSDSCRHSPPNDRRHNNDQTSDPEHGHPSVPDDRGEQDEDGPVVPPQVQESRASTPLLPDDESISDLELTDAEPPLRSQSPRSATSNCGFETQQTSASRPLSQGHEHQDDSSQMSDREQRDPLVPGDRKEQDEEGRAVVPPQAQESVAGIPRLSHDESNNDCELAGAEPSVRSSMQPSASQARPILQRPIGRRRLCDADDGEDYCPTVGSDAEHSEKDDVVRPPRRKRRRVSTVTVATGRTASQRQTRPDRGDSSSREARRSSRHPNRQGKRGAARPPSPRESTLERDSETDGAAAAMFEEWPLGNAVFKRVTMDGSPPTFVVQFTWDPCATHGTGHHGTENRSSVSAAKRHRPATQRSTRYVKDKDITANRKPASTSRRAKYTPEDDAKICQLKEQGLSWLAIAEQFPGRTPGAIEVRYHTKLKTTNTSRSGARQLCDSPQTPSVADDAGEEEWEPYKNVAETETLDEGERRHAETNIWEVDRLLGKWTRGRTTWYLVRWAGYGDEHNTWEERKDIGAELVVEYEAGYEGNDFAIQRLLGKRTRCGRTEYLVEWKGLESKTTWETEADISRIRIREFETNQ